jgi:hypothetical protein
MNVYIMARNALGAYQKDGVRYELRTVPAGVVVRGPKDRQTEAETEAAAASQIGLSAVEPTPDDSAAAKQRKIARLEAQYRAELAKGISVDKITLAATEADQLQFTKLNVLLDGAEQQLPDDAAKSAFEASQQTIADVEGKLHTMSVAELRKLIIAYGQAIAAKWQQLAAGRAAITDATTVTPLEKT